MTAPAIIGIDLGKRCFHWHAQTRHGKLLFRKACHARNGCRNWRSNLPVGWSWNPVPEAINGPLRSRC